jgi:hypothetical protein
LQNEGGITMAIYKFYISTNVVGSKREEIIEIPDEELEGKSDGEKDDYIWEKYYLDFLNNNCDYGWYETDENDEAH